MASQGLGQLIILRRGRLVSRPSPRQMVRLVKHNNVPTCGSEQPLDSTRLLERIDRGDDPRMRLPRRCPVVVKIVA
jgi:hypothetical protein